MRRHGKGTELRDQITRSQVRMLIGQRVASSAELAAQGVDPGLIRFEPIDAVAVAVTDTWESSSYPWASVAQWKLKDAKGFDLAIWYGDELCGLCYATPRKSRLRIKIILLEAKPDVDHSLKGMIAPFALMAVELYARILGCRTIEIQHPEPGAVAYYKALGFDYDEAGCLVISVSDS
jgi:hypothetical protein